MLRSAAGDPLLRRHTTTATALMGVWHRVSVFLARLLGRHTRAAGTVAGTTLAVSIALVFCLSAVQLRVQQVERGHGRVLDRMQAVQADTGKLLDELGSRYRPDCSAGNLKRMRALMFSHRYARNIGVLDDQGRLFCTTGIGLLDTPVVQPHDGIDGSIGRYHLKTPVRDFFGDVGENITATVVERGRFQVLVDSEPTNEAFAEYADAVWAGAGVQRSLVYQGHADGPTDSPVAADARPTRMDWPRARLFVTTTAPGVSPVSLQTVLTPASIPVERLLVAAFGLAVCCLCGYLAANAVRRRCRHFESMDFRIRHLCTDANVVCHYQPILELATGRIVGCEVLARLRDGERLVYPDQFIPALNRRSLGWRFDASVSRAALLELGTALPPQADFSVALNFFPQNLKRHDIHRHLQAVLGEIGRTDLHIDLEVTEYHFSPDLAPELRLLKADGYGISIDDFGTGYSNLGMVKKVSPDHLKIDRSFVHEMEDATVRSSLIPEIIAIASAVGADVVAEGIETQAQATRLRALGVRFGQ